MLQYSEIYGQEEGVRNLKDFIRSERIPHAVLISGPSGSGQLPLALRFAASIQCDQSVDGEACGLCNACNKMEKLIHPDLHIVFPVPNIDKEKKSKYSDFQNEFRALLKERSYLTLTEWLETLNAVDKSPNITAAACRNIIMDLSLGRFEGKYKIMIIWLPEFMGKESNIILKQLEEPSGPTLMILVSEKPEQILPTILSRCQQVKTIAPNLEQVREALLQKGGISIDDASELSVLADGNLAEAYYMVEHGKPGISSQVIEWLGIAFKADPISVMQFSDDFHSKGKADQRYFLQYFLHFLEQALLVDLFPDQLIKLKPVEIEVIHRRRDVFQPFQIEQISNRIYEDLDALNQNANPKISILATTIFLNKVLRGKETSLN